MVLQPTFNALVHMAQFPVPVYKDFLTAFMRFTQASVHPHPSPMACVRPNLMNHDRVSFGHLPAVDACIALMAVSSDKCTILRCTLPKCWVYVLVSKSTLWNLPCVPVSLLDQSYIGRSIRMPHLGSVFQHLQGAQSLGRRIFSDGVWVPLSTLLHRTGPGQGSKIPLRYIFPKSL